MHQILKNRVLPVMAGAAIVVGGMNVASYAGNGHHSAAAHRITAHATGFGHSAAGPQSLKPKKHPVGAYTFAVPKNTTLPFNFKLKFMPKGRYAASLNIATTTATATPPVVPFCSVEDSHSPYAVFSYGQDFGDTINDIAINSASGIIKVAKKGQVGLECSGADETYNTGGSKNVLVLTPLHNVRSVKGKPIPPLRSAQPKFAR
jgi:hypothetical protein